ncbi:MAG: hypothetical protein P8I04_04180 [Algibacter sp.]|uniref:hypothetical protein n=1 Tax=Algibacter sp. TaxID=1872428 RepID=UPI002607D961|nr:hypothetical protein [Algibacter sp.]MDG1729054.1 hypothetical protein [Algibacter sp.]
MKKIILITLTVFLNLALFSCSPQEIVESGPSATDTETGCCGDDGEILPPPTGN